MSGCRAEPSCTGTAYSAGDEGDVSAWRTSATKASPQPNEKIMRVLIDPAGHPFYVYVR
jgi:hypothetical protein